MNQDLSGKEYASLRDELLKWQDRRIIFSQVSITLVIGYMGYILKEQISPVETVAQASRPSWQIISIFPLLLLCITIHLNIVFELFQIRIAAFLTVFYNSTWEQFISEKTLSLSEGYIGYNKSMAIVYFLVSSATVFASYTKFEYDLYSQDSLYFSMVAVIFMFMCYRMFSFSTTDYRRKFREEWKTIHQNAQPGQLPDLAPAATGDHKGSEKDKPTNE